jgi:hypothetical protein
VSFDFSFCNRARACCDTPLRLEIQRLACPVNVRKPSRESRIQADLPLKPSTHFKSGNIEMNLAYKLGSNASCLIASRWLCR